MSAEFIQKGAVVATYNSRTGDVELADGTWIAQVDTTHEAAQAVAKRLTDPAPLTRQPAPERTHK